MFRMMMKSALVMSLAVFGAACDDGGDGSAAGGSGQGGAGGGAAACGNQGNGQTMCVGNVCQAGQYCDSGFCNPGCTSDENCGMGEVCQREAGAAVGACAPCTPPVTGQGGAGGGGSSDCAAFCNKSEECSGGQITAAMCQSGGFCASIPSACRACVIASDCGDINNNTACVAECSGGGGGGAGGGGVCAIGCDIDSDCDTNNCFNNCCECNFAGCGCDLDADCESGNCFQNECQL